MQCRLVSIVTTFHKPVQYSLVSMYISIDGEEQLLNRCIVQYHFNGNEHEISIRPHGNSRRSDPHIRTMPSTLDKLTEIASEKLLNQLFHLNVEVFLKLPQQVYCQEIYDR